MDNNILQEFINNINRCNCDKIHMIPPAFMHAAIGIQDEAGEIAEILKRALYYGDNIDSDHLIEEYGDLMFYIVLDCMRIAAIHDFPVSTIFDRVLLRNIAKLEERYKVGFTEAEATETGRDRTAEKDAMNQTDLEDLGRGVRKHEEANQKKA